jgi:hypothetical protein
MVLIRTKKDLKFDKNATNIVFDYTLKGKYGVISNKIKTLNLYGKLLQSIIEILNNSYWNKINIPKNIKHLSYVKKQTFPNKII